MASLAGLENVRRANKPRAIFFDVGDTLVFDRPSLMERIGQGLVQLGCGIDEANLSRGMRCAEEYVLPLYAAGVDTEALEIQRQALERICDSAGLPKFGDDLWAEFFRTFAEIGFTRYVHPQAEPMLAFLAQQGVYLGIISDWDRDLAQLLSDLNVGRYFQSLSVSAIVGARKPASALFQHALNQAGVHAGEAVHFGDFYELDYIGARSIGMSAILFDWRGRTEGSEVDRVSTFTELSDVVRGLFRD